MIEDNKFDDTPIINPNANNFEMMIAAYEEKMKNMPIPEKKNNVAKVNKNKAKEQINLEEIDEENLSPEEIDEVVSSLISNEVVLLSNSTKWEERKQAFLLIKEYINLNDNANKHGESIMKFIQIKVKNFKENNFNIIKEGNELIELLIEKNMFNNKFLKGLLNKLSDKWGDIKLKQSINNLFIKLSENFGPKSILFHLLKSIPSKNLTINKEFSSFIIILIEDFGIKHIPMKEVIDYSKANANNTNPAIRQLATNIFCCIFKYIGELLKNFLKDGSIKEATLKVIEGELEKTEIVGTDVEAKRHVKGDDNKSNQNIVNNKKGEGKTVINMDNIFPRVDISKKITSKMIKDFIEGKWTIKKEVIDSIIQIINEANCRILPNGLGDLIAAIKNKLNDGNKNLVKILISFLGKLFEALGKESRQYDKSLFPGILSNLSDKNNLVREEVIKCVETYIDIDLFDSLIPFIPQGLIVDNYEYRNEVLKLLIKHKSKINAEAKYDFKELIPSITSCLMDKNPNIRKLAEDLFKDILTVVHLSNFQSFIITTYKPAQQSQLKAIFEKYSGVLQVGINQNLINSSNNLNKEGGIINNNTSNINTNKNNNQKKKSIENNKIQKEEIKERKSETTIANNTLLVPNNQPQPNSTNQNNRQSKISLGNKNQQSNQIPAQNISNSTNITNSNIQTNFLKTINIKPKHKQSRIQYDLTQELPSAFYTQPNIKNLKSTMTMYITDIYINENAFSSDWNRISTFISQLKQSLIIESFCFMEVTDLIFKWLMIKNYELNMNIFFNNSLFDFLNEFLKFLNEYEFDISEFEVRVLLEILSMKIINNVSNQSLKDRAIKVIIDLSKLRRFTRIDWFIVFFSNKVKQTDLIIKKLEVVELINSLFEHNGIFDNKKNGIECLLSLIIFDSSSFYGISNENSSSINNKFNSDVCVKINSIIFEIINRINDPETTLLIINTINSIQIRTFLEENLRVFLNKANLKSINSHITSNPETIVKGIDKKLTISKSPIFIRRKSQIINKESEKDNLIYSCDEVSSMCLSKQELNLLINQILDDDHKIGSFESLIKIYNIVKDYWNPNKGLFDTNISLILTSFVSLLKRILHSIDNDPELLDRVKYILTIVYKIVNSSSMEYMTEDSLLEIYSKLIQSINISNLENLRKNTSNEGRIIINSLNAILISLLERVDINKNFSSLFLLLINKRKALSKDYSLTKSNIFVKEFCLLIKLLKKISESISSYKCSYDINFDQLFKYLFSIIENISILHPDLNIPKANILDAFSFKIVKQYIYYTAQIENLDIWELYNKEIANYDACDHFKKVINSILNLKNDGKSRESSAIKSFKEYNIDEAINDNDFDLKSNSENNSHLINLNSQLQVSSQTGFKAKLSSLEEMRKKYQNLKARQSSASSSNTINNKDHIFMSNNSNNSNLGVSESLNNVQEVKMAELKEKLFLLRNKNKENK